LCNGWSTFFVRRVSQADGRTNPAYLVYRYGQLVASALPERVLFEAAHVAGGVVARWNGRKREVVRRNMSRVVDRDLEAFVDEAFRTYARYWAETLRIPKPGTAEIMRRTTSEGLDGMAKLLDAGRGVLFVSPHTGALDVAGAFLAGNGWRVIAVAEELEPPALFELFAKLRRSVGVEVHPAGKGSSARALLTGLRNGAAVGLVADRDITGTGVEVEFCGEKTRLPTGPAVLALRTGAPVAVGTLYQRPGGRYHAVVLDPIEVPPGRADPEQIRELTQRIAHGMEELIKREPGQWHLFQPNWPSDPGYKHANS
jgi:lauroyl/myristoyl acyltransferase